jgi:hypothetical protein
MARTFELAISGWILGVQDWKKQNPTPGNVGFDKVSSQQRITPNQCRVLAH